MTNPEALSALVEIAKAGHLSVAEACRAAYQMGQKQADSTYQERHSQDMRRLAAMNQDKP